MEFSQASGPPAFTPPPALPPPVRVPLLVFPEHPCSYLPGRVAASRGFWARSIAPAIYRQFMDAGFRRSGRLIYQPACRGCSECRSLRVPVNRFKMRKSQRRCWRRNADLVVTAGPPLFTQEKFDLYSRYINEWHGGEPGRPEDLEAFLYDSPVETLEFSYRDGAGTLLAAGICDVCPTSLSSVYFYFDPAVSLRALGTFGALYELNFARRQGLTHYYLGFWIKECASMSYKAAYGPSEVLGADGVWRLMDQ